MLWNNFIYFAIVAVVMWAGGAYMAWRDKRNSAFKATAIGLAVFFAYICFMWGALERPPLRTMGETRLWYSLFLPMAGLAVYARWKYKWILTFTTIMATVFVCVNIFKPEIHSKALMPALQSPWFAPHVIVYMMAYAILGAATLVAIYQLLRKTTVGDGEATLVRTGWAFMTFGMLFGALWAKEAWGHYWSWDPKETWAAITWLAYLAYMHYTHMPRHNRTLAQWMLIAAFCLLQMCWWGINYLPAAKGISVHSYGS